MAAEGLRQIGRYRDLEEIGRGAMGIVYRAFDPDFERPLAIKIVNMPYFATEAKVAEARLRFAREADAAAGSAYRGESNAAARLDERLYGDLLSQRP